MRAAWILIQQNYLLWPLPSSFLKFYLSIINLLNSIIVCSKRGGGGGGSGREAQEKEKPVDRGSNHSCETLAGTWFEFLFLVNSLF